MPISASRSTPVSTPWCWSRYTRSSVATLPVARGAYGQPPSPPTDASSTRAPPSSAASAFAYPVLRVLWPWKPSASVCCTSVRTCVGVATPIVSARTISARSPKRDERSATAPGSTRPSNGQPNATLIVTVAGTSTRASIASTRTVASCSDAFPFSRLNVSVAPSVRLTRPSAAASKRSRPRSLSTSAEYSVPSCGSSAATTSSAPAICGTRSSRTKLTASTRGSPARARRAQSCARVGGGSVSGSFCSPSRGPTSQTVNPSGTSCRLRRLRRRGSVLVERNRRDLASRRRAHDVADDPDEDDHRERPERQRLELRSRNAPCFLERAVVDAEDLLERAREDRDPRAERDPQRHDHGADPEARTPEREHVRPLHLRILVTQDEDRREDPEVRDQ